MGDIYLYFTCETADNKVIAGTGKSVGFDFGLKTFLNASDGEDITAPLFLKQNAKAIKQANRRLSRKRKGSNNGQKAKIELARLHKKIADERNDFHWKTANQIVGKYALICLEKLNIKGMQRRFGRKISDLGFAEFVNKLKYMAEKTGSKVVKIDRFYPSSQLCKQCGHQNKVMKDLKMRDWICPECNAEHNRDKNAAINILSEGKRIFSAT